MRKQNTYIIALLMILLLFSSCGEKKDAATVETPSKEETVKETSEEKVDVSKELIKAEEDPFTWPEPAKESDFDFDEETGTILGYSGTEKVLVIPPTIQNKPVLRIGNAAFQKQDQLTHIKFPENLRVIQTSAFYFLEKIEHLSLPSTLEIIEPYAFFHCTSLKTVTFPSSLFYLGKYAFFGFEGEKNQFPWRNSPHGRTSNDSP